MYKKNYYLKNANRLGWGIKSATLNKARRRILDNFVLGSKVLDIGCGTGIYVDYLSKKGKEVFGIDFVENFIKYAEKHRRGKFLIAKAGKLPFNDKTFDTVIMFDLLEHLDDPVKTLKEAVRVTKKRIILIVPRESDISLKKHGLIFNHYLDRTHLRYYTKKKLKVLIKKTRLIKTRVLKRIRPISIESLFFLQFKNPFFVKLIFKKLIFAFLKPKKFYLDILFVGDVNK